MEDQGVYMITERRLNFVDFNLAPFCFQLKGRKQKIFTLERYLKLLYDWENTRLSVVVFDRLWNLFPPLLEIKNNVFYAEVAARGGAAVCQSYRLSLLALTVLWEKNNSLRNISSNAHRTTLRWQSSINLPADCPGRLLMSSVLLIHLELKLQLKSPPAVEKLMMQLLIKLQLRTVPGVKRLLMHLSPMIHVFIWNCLYTVLRFTGRCGIQSARSITHRSSPTYNIRLT